MSRRRYRKYDDKTLNAVVMILLFVFLMPIAGIKLLGSENAFLKIVGGVLVVLGVIIWINLAAG